MHVSVACANSATVCRDTDSTVTSSVCVPEGNGFLCFGNEEVPMNRLKVTCSPWSGAAFEDAGSCSTAFLGAHSRKNPSLDSSLSHFNPIHVLIPHFLKEYIYFMYPKMAQAVSFF